jgi:hypothetical protein
MNDRLMTAPELARELRVDPKQLRKAIRDGVLMPGHVKGTHYRLDPDDVARIRSDAAVRRLPRR